MSSLVIMAGSTVLHVQGMLTEDVANRAKAEFERELAKLDGKSLITVHVAPHHFNDRTMRSLAREMFDLVNGTMPDKAVTSSRA